MAARGAQGNPFLFTQIRELLSEGKVRTYPTEAERIAMCLRQARIAVREKGEALAIKQMRGHAAHYVKGMKGAAGLRAQVVHAESYAQLEEILNGWLAKK